MPLIVTKEIVVLNKPSVPETKVMAQTAYFTPKISEPKVEPSLPSFGAVNHPDFIEKSSGYMSHMFQA
jgi:hypothetical protein